VFRGLSPPVSLTAVIILIEPGLLKGSVIYFDEMAKGRISETNFFLEKKFRQFSLKRNTLLKRTNFQNFCSVRLSLCVPVVRRLYVTVSSLSLPIDLVDSLFVLSGGSQGSQVLPLTAC